MKKSVKKFSLVMGMAVAMELSIVSCPNFVNALDWQEGATYNLGEVVTYSGVNYKCLVGHTAWAGTNWNPASTPSLWGAVDGTNVEPWQQGPTGQDEEEPWQQEPIWQGDEPAQDIELIESKGEWGEKIFAPYVDVLLYPYADIGNLMQITGNKYYTLAFITSKSGMPAWGGVEDYNKNTTDAWEAVTHIRNGIRDVREAGGDVIVSFGGANGRELAMDITDVAKLQKAYQNVIDEYKLTWIDFDIEGFAVADKASIQRRNEAIVGLQNANPDLTIAYCLPVMPEGLTADGLYVLQDAKEKGVKIDVVNIMTMDYGPAYSNDMGDYAIEAAENTEKQIRNIGLNSKIGNTPMIGTNDVSVEKFMQEDAKQLLDWAKNKDSVRLLSMWSITRDKATGTGLYNYTMIPQNDYDFTNIFKEFNS